MEKINFKTYKTVEENVSIFKTKKPSLEIKALNINKNKVDKTINLSPTPSIVYRETKNKEKIIKSNSNIKAPQIKLKPSNDKKEFTYQRKTESRTSTTKEGSEGHSKTLKKPEQLRPLLTEFNTPSLKYLNSPIKSKLNTVRNVVKSLDFNYIKNFKK